MRETTSAVLWISQVLFGPAPGHRCTRRSRARALCAGFSIFFAAIGSQAQTRYIAFGDSITAGINFDETCTCQCPELCGYPRRLEQMLRTFGEDATVDNRGKGGETTPQGLTRLSEVLKDGGDDLLLMEGTNDISQRISRETTLFNLNKMAERAADAGLSTTHATLIPRRPDTSVDPDNELNEQLAQRIRTLAFEEDRRLIDPFRAFLDVADLDALYNHDFPGDVGHPNSRGYAKLAEFFFNALIGRDRIPPVLGLVEPPPGAEDEAPMVRIRLRLYDFGSGIDPSSVHLAVNGFEVPFTSTGDGHAMEVTHLPTQPLQNPVSVTIQARDLTLPHNELDQEATHFTVGTEPPEPCVPDVTTLCIDHRPGDRRFKVTMSWFTALNGGSSGVAAVTPLDVIGLPAGGILSFFPSNPEVLIKILDGCGTNHHHWLFVAATTTLGFDLRIEDTLARTRGAGPLEYEYRIQNADGNFAQPAFDIQAFDTCEYNQ